LRRPRREESYAPPVRESLPGHSCYGVNWEWTGLAPPAELLGAASRSWPTVRVEQIVRNDDGMQPLDSDHELILRLLSGGHVRLRRKELEATYFVPALLDAEELVHPYLAPAGYRFSTWFGREAYHAGAFLLDGRAWAVVGEREGGKSSTLAWLSRQGHAVLCDDLLVIDQGQVLPGPRCIDLRETAAAQLGTGERLPSVRSGGRWRLPLGPTGPAFLAGWIFLRWGPTVTIRPLSPKERLSLILALGRPADSSAPLTLAAAPAWEVVRPKVWGSLQPALDSLFKVVLSR
jgi:hypothetical protein